MLEMLDKRELSKIELFDEIRRESEISTSDKTLNESLMSLLKENEIYITGYDFDIYDGVKRIQSIRTEGLVFGRVKLNFVEIENLIAQLETTDVETVKKASYKLKMLFRKKFEELEYKNISEGITEDFDAFFNRTIYYIKSQKKEQKDSLWNKLAWSLSNDNGSDDIFLNIINYVKYH
ncbi:hypothetical protein MSWAN_1511 [Methanobacterium paludis]|uniref:Uncharacterized protein n=2 Tax=Methanobacterium paludis (strain DSM 25820 / JCM 18151 / SWAN1) TaxID=868131 RepID=F6D802_METPW|nr:hypothetical protein MSWAN_1511 [Methanobacterium paludis]